MADWELKLAAPAQHHERILYGTSLVQEKSKIQNSKYSFHWMYIIFAPS